jgi:TolA-binding protein
VISDGEGSFVELSILNFANISYSLERWEEAYGGYSSLYSSALLENNTFVALTGMLRSAYRGRDWANAIQKADMLMEDQRSDEDLKVEAKYVKAKSYLATSRRDAAMEILNELAADPKTEYGAEAAYLLIVDCYDRGEFEEVENKVYAFADSGSEQTYWLAKGFVILGDSFVERGELKQARATFESVLEGYSSQRNDDDVISSIEMRLTKLEEIENKDI